MISSNYALVLQNNEKMSLNADILSLGSRAGRLSVQAIFKCNFLSFFQFRRDLKNARTFLCCRKFMQQFRKHFPERSYITFKHVKGFQG